MLLILLYSANAIAQTNTNFGNLTVGSVNNVSIAYVDGLHYKTIQAAVNALPTINNKPAGVVWVTVPTAMTSGQEVTIGPFTQLHFGANGSVFYTGNGIAFSCSDAPTTYQGDGGIFDLNLTGTSSGAIGINVNECTWFHLEHIHITGFTKGKGILFQNTQKWTEQSTWFDVQSSHNLVDYDFEDNCSGHTGCPSFGYTRMYHVVANPTASDDGFQFENDSDLAHSDFEINCFLDQNSTCLHLKNTSSVGTMRMWIRGEFTTPCGGCTTASGILTDAGTFFQPFGLMEHWHQGSGRITDFFAVNTRSSYIFNIPGSAYLQDNSRGLIIGAFGNSFYGLFDVHNVTGNRTYTAPDISGTNEVIFASGITEMPARPLAPNTCSSAITVATTGVTTSMQIHWNLASTPVGVAGYGSSPVTINAWLTSGKVNFIQCATTAVTPGTMSLHWEVTN